MKNERKSGYLENISSCSSPTIDRVVLLITPPNNESTYPLHALATDAAPTCIHN